VRSGDAESVTHRLLNGTIAEGQAKIQPTKWVSTSNTISYAIGVSPGERRMYHLRSTSYHPQSIDKLAIPDIKRTIYLY
jgi:hypothetical protein